MFRIGVNIASDKIKAAVVDEYFRIIGRGESEKKSKRTADELESDVTAVINHAMADARIDSDYILSIGIATPGTVDKGSGIVEHASNFDFELVPLRDMLWKSFDKPIYLENDANCLALGEYKAGVGSRGDCLMAVTINKGVGGGIILDGKILGGCNGTAGEVGHMVINVDGEQCTCGRRGCFETYASIRALVDGVKKELENDKSSMLWGMIDNNLDNLNEKHVYEAIGLGDELANKVFEKYVYYLSVGMTNIVNIFQPSTLVIGGDICTLGNTLLNPIRRMVEEQRFSVHSFWQTDICLSGSGSDMTLIGAALLDE
ncbi:MAG: ROK family protein [Ruminococcaceae bacterium]|jgi:glucokinase|nr:ROK family protein [Oscillospiraceae bacterium]